MILKSYGVCLYPQLKVSAYPRGVLTYESNTIFTSKTTKQYFFIIYILKTQYVEV